MGAFSQAFGLDPICANNARTWGGLSVCDWKLPWRDGFELAHQAGVSRAHFARHFRSVTGMSPHQYVLLRRTEKAKALLSNTRHGLLRIAQEVGFGSQSHFSQVFHAITGKTPSKFRQSQ